MLRSRRPDPQDRQNFCIPIFWTICQLWPRRWVGNGLCPRMRNPPPLVVFTWFSHYLWGDLSSQSEDNVTLQLKLDMVNDQLFTAQWNVHVPDRNDWMVMVLVTVLLHCYCCWCCWFSVHSHFSADQYSPEQIGAQLIQWNDECIIFININIIKNTNTNMYIYIYVRVCVCACSRAHHGDGSSVTDWRTCCRVCRDVPFQWDWWIQWTRTDSWVNEWLIGWRIDGSIDRWSNSIFDERMNRCVSMSCCWLVMNFVVYLFDFGCDCLPTCLLVCVVVSCGRLSIVYSCTVLNDWVDALTECDVCIMLILVRLLTSCERIVSGRRDNGYRMMCLREEDDFSCSEYKMCGKYVASSWRNGSASDSRSEGCVFESRRAQYFCTHTKIIAKICFTSLTIPELTLLAKPTSCA